jgi:peptide subunit release factor 1 (eRF1)
MADNIADVLQELSGLLRRISERRNELKPQLDENNANTLKNIELFVQGRAAEGEQDQRFRERLIETLEHQNHLLESLIARLQEKPRKG